MDSFLHIIQETITDIQNAKSMSSADKKALVVSTVTRLVNLSPLSDAEKQLVLMTLPILANDFTEIEVEVKSCFSWLKKKL